MVIDINIHKHNTRKQHRSLNAVKKIQNKFRTKMLRNRFCRLSKYKNCSICFNRLFLNNVIFMKNCEHVFHKSCLDRWLIYEPICPNCRTTIPESKNPRKTKNLNDIFRQIFATIFR